MSPAAPTARSVCIAGLREFGIISLNSASPAGQNRKIEAGDGDEVCRYMTSALQEMFDLGPAEMKEKPGNGVLFAPTTITVTATSGSTAITSSGFTAAMAGCTIRIGNDDQDNEILSATLLARPFLGTGASGASAIVYGDCLTLDDSISEVQGPVFLSNGSFLQMAQGRQQFLELGLYPYGGVTTLAGGPVSFASNPFFYFGRKAISQYPFTWIVDGYADTSLDYLPRRLRFAPMPSVQLGCSYTAVVTPPRIDFATNVDTGDHTTDPGTKLPVPNGWSESVFSPILRQHLTASALFKNEGGKTEIARGYQAALTRLRRIKGGGGPMIAKYPRVS